MYKRIVADEVPTDFAAMILNAYSHDFSDANDARRVSWILRDCVPFRCQSGGLEAYWGLDEKVRAAVDDEFWRKFDEPQKLSDLIAKRDIDCNVLSIAIAQTIPDTIILRKPQSSANDPSSKTTLHTFTAHPLRQGYLCVDITKAPTGTDYFFYQDSIALYTRMHF